MNQIPTVAVKDGAGYKIINESEFKEGEMERYEGATPSKTVTDFSRNADGTFSEPTPSDIRYPNMDNTEFANNHGALLGRNAADLRKEMGLPDAPGGVTPDPKLVKPVEEAKKAEEDAQKELAEKAAQEAKDAEGKTGETSKPAAPAAKK